MTYSEDVMQRYIRFPNHGRGSISSVRCQYYIHDRMVLRQDEVHRRHRRREGAVTSDEKTEED